MPLRPSSLANFQRPLYLWNLMIRDSTNDGFFTETLKIYSCMQHSGVHGNNFTYPLLLKACASLYSIPHGTMLHGRVLRLGFQGDTFVQTALVDMYSKCSLIASARQVFDEMPHRSVVSWNAMVSAYSRGSWLDQALSLLKEMLALGFDPSSSTFVSILSGCSNLNSLGFLWQGMSIHSCAIKLGLVCFEVSVANSLMGMYAQFRKMDEARKVFDLMDEKSIISWTTIMGGYVKIGDAVEALKLFNQMQHQSIDIDFVVFLSLISGCIQVGELLLASSVHSLVLKCGCDGEDSIENLLITMYANCGNLTSARKIFDLITGKSILSWTSMIAGYAHSGHPVEALDLFRRLVRTDIRPNGATLATVLSACADLGSLGMGQEIEEYVHQNGLELDQQVQTSLIHMYSKCGSIEKAREVFERVTNKDLTTWTSMINSYAIHGMGNEAISLFDKMTIAEGSLHKALVAANLNFRVKVSTPQSMDIIPKPFPPSTAAFNSSLNSTIYQLLQFLKNTNSSYMLNAYPYYGYTKGDGIFPIEYALFRPLPSVKQIVDPNTLFHYNSMFDAMVDATYYSIEALNFKDIPIVVTETGWPWFGGANEPDATVENAETYNNNMIRRVLNDSGPPSHSDIAINTYIYELFNEDKRNGPMSEKNWGIFFTNGSAVYPLSYSASGRIIGNSSATFCVAKDGADTDKLQDGLSWACGQGGANCAAIQQGQRCYLPNNPKSHASYAYNDYYQKKRSAGGTCDFDGTAEITTRDPSHGSCIFTGSSNASAVSLPPMALGPSSPLGASVNLQVSSLQYLISAIGVLFALVML